jgi:cyclophilin family peptidyl-prolyl cis-trans isomerase
MLALSAAGLSPGGVVSQRRPRAEAPPPPERVDVEELKDLQAVIETEFGTIAIEFFAQDAPRHVAYFVHLARQGFYDGTTFHRIYPGYMMLGGDPLTRGEDRSLWGRGWSGEFLPAEISRIEFDRGVVGMLPMKPEDPNSGSAIFFICLGRAPHLDGKYTAFGRVVEGMDVLEKFEKLETDAQKAPVPKVPIRFRVVRVEEGR